MDDLVANLLAAYRESISTLDWMTEETKAAGLRQARDVPPEDRLPGEVPRLLRARVRPDDLLGNVAAASAFETDRQLAKIGSPVDRDEWFMLPQTVNAYYNPGTNEICFPAGILQKPFFSPDADPAENYGGIGAVIGHEIGHGFDDQGAQYDGDGNLNDWWTAGRQGRLRGQVAGADRAVRRLRARASCPARTSTAQLTVGENIGDLGGLTIGHKAYVIAQGGTADAEERQPLFMNWAYCWRTKRRLEQASSTSPSTRTARRSSAPTSCATSTSSTRSSRPHQGDGLWLDPEQRVRIW